MPMPVYEKPVPPANMLARFDRCMLPIGNEAGQVHKINQAPSLCKSRSFVIKKDNIAVVKNRIADKVWTTTFLCENPNGTYSYNRSNRKEPPWRTDDWLI